MIEYPDHWLIQVDPTVQAILMSKESRNYTLGQDVEPWLLLTILSNLKHCPSDKAEIGSYFWASTVLLGLCFMICSWFQFSSCIIETSICDCFDFFFWCKHLGQ